MPDLSTSRLSEYCEDCGAETSHEIAIELITESDREERSAFTRKPPRVATCTACGRTVREFTYPNREKQVYSDGNG